MYAFELKARNLQSALASDDLKYRAYALYDFLSKIVLLSAIDLDDGAFSIRKNGGFWVKVFHWNGGEIREEDRFIAAN